MTNETIPCWNCGKQMFPYEGGYKGECGATTVGSYNKPTKIQIPKVKPGKPNNGSIVLTPTAELAERLINAAHNRNIMVEEYALQILNREAGRRHDKKIVKEV